MMTSVSRREALLLGAMGAAALAVPAEAATRSILNVSYDPTRELYKAFDAAFTAYWQKKGGESVHVEQSHGGSGAQARAVIDGLKADVVTLALEADIDAIAEKTGKIARNWRTRLPGNSCPYTSTIVFLARSGNPKGIKDWGDLAKPGVQVVTPNPKTSGGARWNVLAAWAWADEHFAHDQAKMRAFLGALFKNVPVLDSGARGATNTFSRRGIGDVLLAWENEAFLAQKELGAGQLDVVVPSISVKAEPPVALVDGNVDAKGTRALAEAYLQYLYSPEGQKIVAANYYRPYKAEGVPAQDLARFPKLKLAAIDDPLFGGWKKAQPKFFGDGGLFDQIYKPG